MLNDLLQTTDKAKEIYKKIKVLFPKQEYKKLSMCAKIRKWFGTYLAQIKNWIDNKIKKNEAQSNEEKHKYSDKPNNMYAIYGGWGTGKTRLLEELEVLIKNHYKVFWFRPWEYFEESQNIDKKLLFKILDQDEIWKWLNLGGILFVIMTIFTIGNMQWFQANLWKNFIALNLNDYFVVIGVFVIILLILYKFNIIQFISNLGIGSISFDIAKLYSNLRDYTESSEEIQKEIFDKPKHFLNLDSIKKLFGIDRRITVKEFLQVAFGEKEAFEMKDELLESEWQKFMEINPVDQEHYATVKTFFKAYITDTRVRDIIKSRQTGRFHTESSFHFEEYQQLDNYKTLVPQYIEDYAYHLTNL